MVSSFLVFLGTRNTCSIVGQCCWSGIIITVLIFFNSVGLPYKLSNILAWSWYRDAMLLKISIRKFPVLLVSG